MVFLRRIFSHDGDRSEKQPTEAAELFEGSLKELMERHAGLQDPLDLRTSQALVYKLGLDPNCEEWIGENGYLRYDSMQAAKDAIAAMDGRLAIVEESLQGTYDKGIDMVIAALYANQIAYDCLVVFAGHQRGIRGRSRPKPVILVRPRKPQSGDTDFNQRLQTAREACGYSGSGQPRRS